MARRRQGEPGVTVLLLCYLGGRDRVIVPPCLSASLASFGKGRGIYTINTPDINTTSSSSPPTFTRQDLFGQPAQPVSLAFSFVMASSSSPPPLSHHQQTVDCHHFVISSRTIGKHEILYITDLEPSTFDSPLLYPPAYQSLPRHPYLPFRPRLARPFLRLFPYSVYNPNLHSVDPTLLPIRRAYHH